MPFICICTKLWSCTVGLFLKLNCEPFFDKCHWIFTKQTHSTFGWNTDRKCLVPYLVVRQDFQSCRAIWRVSASGKSFGSIASLHFNNFPLIQWPNQLTWNKDIKEEWTKVLFFTLYFISGVYVCECHALYRER